MRSTFPSNASVTSIRRWRGGSRSDPSRVPLIPMEMAVSRSLMPTVTPLAMSMCLRVRLWSADGCSSQGTIGASLQAQRGSAATFTLVASTKTRERPRRVSKRNKTLSGYPRVKVLLARDAPFNQVYAEDAKSFRWTRFSRCKFDALLLESSRKLQCVSCRPLS